MILSDKLRAAELPHVYRELADLIGVENALRIAAYYAGRTVYFPYVDRLIRNEIIRQEYKGYNVKELAERYRLSERQIRNIVGRR